MRTRWNIKIEKKTTVKRKLTTQLEEINKKILAKETQNETGTGSSNTSEIGHSENNLKKT